MRILAFAKRNFKEIIIDPLNLAFGIGFPLILIVILSLIQNNIPVSLFEIESLAPGITVFGLSFITLFVGLIIAKDRSSYFLHRLYTTPMKPVDFIFGYILPVIPIAIFEAIICYLFSLIFGLKLSINIVYGILFIIPIAIFYIAFGMLCGSIFNDKQVGAICGALFTNLSAWLSGIWFDLELVGGVFKKIAYFLPFYHSVELERLIIKGSYQEIFSHLVWILIYDLLLLILSVLAFLKQMKEK